MITCNGGRCTVQGPVTMGNVVALVAQGRELFTAPHTTVDFAAVTEVDSSAVSLLLEWRREAARANRKITFVNLPDNLKSLATVYGVADLIATDA